MNQQWGVDMSVSLCSYVTVQGSHDSRHRHKTESAKRKETGSKIIEELRAERVRREQKERQRAEQLLVKMQHGSGSHSEQPAAVDDDRQRRYNSQFNPDIARRPRPRDSVT